MKAGHVLQKCDLAIKVANPRGMDAALIITVIGRKVNTDLEEDEPLLMENLS